MPNTTYQINVGGRGTSGGVVPGSGGGASDVRTGGFTLGERSIVAGGGGHHGVHLSGGASLRGLRPARAGLNDDPASGLRRERPCDPFRIAGAIHPGRRGLRLHRPARARYCRCLGIGTGERAGLWPEARAACGKRLTGSAAADYVLSRAPLFPGIEWLYFVCPEKTEHRTGFDWDAAPDDSCAH